MGDSDSTSLVSDMAPYKGQQRASKRGEFQVQSVAPYCSARNSKTVDSTGRIPVPPSKNDTYVYNVEGTPLNSTTAANQRTSSVTVSPAAAAEFIQPATAR